MTKLPTPDRTRQDLLDIVETSQAILAAEPRFRTVRHAYLRGGLPSTSIAAPTRALSEPPLPIFDRDDRQLLLAERLLGETAVNVRTSLRGLLTTMLAWTTPAEAVPEPDVCTCGSCGKAVTVVGERRLRPSRYGRGRICSACPMHEARHGLPWPKVRTEG